MDIVRISYSGTSPSAQSILATYLESLFLHSLSALLRAFIPKPLPINIIGSLHPSAHSSKSITNEMHWFGCSCNPVNTMPSPHLYNSENRYISPLSWICSTSWLNHSYWEWNVCLDINICECLVSNQTNMSNFQPLEVVGRGSETQL